MGHWDLLAASLHPVQWTKAQSGRTGHLIPLLFPMGIYR